MIYGRSRRWLKWDNYGPLEFQLGRRSRRHQLRMQDSWRRSPVDLTKDSGLRVIFRVSPEFYERRRS